MAAPSYRPIRAPTIDIYCGDVREVLRQLPEHTVQVVVTSPPYWGLRNYGVEGALGSEKTVEEYVANLVEVFTEVWRVLRDDGSVYLNLGDCYAGSGRGGNPDAGTKQGTNRGSQTVGVLYGRDHGGREQERRRIREQIENQKASGLRPKDLIGVPWRVAFALRDWGWYLREDIVWHKPNPMPESVVDRCTRSHEFVFHLTKSDRYFYDHEAIKEPYADATLYEADHSYGGTETKDYEGAKAQKPSASKRRILASIKAGTGRNKRDVWTIPVQPYRGGHFATFPEKLVEPCILAASSEGGECSACGAPYRRVTEKEPIPDEIKAKFEEARARTREATGRTDGHTNFKPNFRRAVRTVGFAPSCKCGVDPVPQIVMDPFLGSGRAGIVAKRLGRSVIGIDLNPDYVLQAMQNIEGETPALILDKQAGHGPRHKGFNARWEEGGAA